MNANPITYQQISKEILIYKHAADAISLILMFYALAVWHFTD